MFNVSLILDLQLSLTKKWHDVQGEVNTRPGAESAQERLLRLTSENHLTNFVLWHQEDLARSDDHGYKGVWLAKRTIDHYNLQRSGFIELMDQAIASVLRPLEPFGEHQCPCNSETPGMIIDRLSILALKEHHMEEFVDEAAEDDPERGRLEAKLEKIKGRRQALGRCLQELLYAVARRQRTFLLHSSFKMYKDPMSHPSRLGEQSQIVAG